MMTDSIRNILGELAKMKPLDASGDNTPFEGRCRRISTILLYWASAAFAVLILLLVWAKLLGPASGAMKCVGIAIAVVCQISASLALVINCIPAALMMLSFQKRAIIRLTREFEHDQNHAEMLDIHGKAALQGADEYLRIYIERRKAYVGAFTGPMENLAMFSVVALAWNVFKEFDGPHAQPFNTYIQFGIAFLGGIDFGCFFMSLVLRRYTYFRDLIALNLSMRDRRGPVEQ